MTKNEKSVSQKLIFIRTFMFEGTEFEKDFQKYFSNVKYVKIS